MIYTRTYNELIETELGLFKMATAGGDAKLQSFGEIVNHFRESFNGDLIPCLSQ